MQWSIGFSRGDIEQIIKEKNNNLSFKWLPLKNNDHSIADPFIFKDIEGNLNLLYEDFSMINTNKYGKIGLSQINKNFNIVNNKEILDTKSHCSYPFIFFEDGIMYVIPETSSQNKVSAFEYDYASKSLVNEKVLISDLPLLDSTVIKYNNKYWLFATVGKNGNDHKQLNIYFADSLFGTYKPHKGNPVKDNPEGARPAGNIFSVDGVLYRPAQNCSHHYGESITINKINILTENEFSEEYHFKIVPDKNCEFNAGVHTINLIDDIIVIDGIKMVFAPFTKWLLYLKKKFLNNYQ